MLVSELVSRSGVPLASIKYYLREGLLMPGHATSATRADYDETHVRRLRLIKGLSGVGLSLGRIKAIIALIDEPGPSLFDALGTAVYALSPPPVADESHPRATAALELLGTPYLPDHPAVAQLEHALAAAEACGVGMTDDQLRAYAPHIEAIAAVDIALMPRDDPAAAIEYVVLGTILYEPIIAALRRLGHAALAADLLDKQGDLTHDV